MIYTKTFLLRFLSHLILESLARFGYCRRVNPDKFEWLETGRLFVFLCWYLTELGEKNGLRMYKGLKQTNIKDYCTLFENPPKFDRSLFSEFRIGGYPARWERIAKVVDMYVESTINTELKKI